MNDKVEKWIRENAKIYVENFGSAEVAVQRLVMDANVDCHTEEREADIGAYARQVLAKELAAESEKPVEAN